MKQIEQITFDDFVELMKSLLGEVVSYSRCGGCVGSLLLIIFPEKSGIWAWRYWELSHMDELLASSTDQWDPETDRRMSDMTQRLEGKRLLGFSFSDGYDLVLLFEGDIELTIFSDDEGMLPETQLRHWEVSDDKHDITFECTKDREIIAYEDK